MKEKELLALLKAIAPVIEKRISRHVSPVFDRLKVRYKGIWQPGAYSRNAVVTMRGSLWLCFRETTTKPGAGDDWRLVVKAGRDAPDAPTA